MELEVKEQDKGALLLMPQLLLTMKIQVKYGVVFVWQEELKCLVKNLIQDKKTYLSASHDGYRDYQENLFILDNGFFQKVY